MYKLLVNTPAGVQQVIIVGEGGGYLDPARVLWDEREDGPLPDISIGGMIRVGDALEVDSDMLAVSQAGASTANAAAARAQYKAERAVAVAAITATVTSGKTFDGDEDSQTRMARAIIGMQAAGVTTITWTLADNTSTAVTLADLTEALILSGQQQAALWPIP